MSSMIRRKLVEPKAREYRGRDWQILVGDARSVPWARPGSVDLLFADPPFNIAVDYRKGGTGWNDNLPSRDYTNFTHEWMAVVDRVVRPGGSIFIHVPDDVVATVLDKAETFAWHRRGWLIWHYRFGQNTFDNFINSHAHLLYFIKDYGVSRHVWNVAHVLEPSERLLSGDKRTRSSPHKGMRPFLDVWQGRNLGRVQGNNAERRPLHPNQLPEMYLARIIRAASLPEDVVADPFVGSGTTPTVAVALGRRFTGCEVSPQFAASAARRVRKGPVRDVAGQLWEQKDDGDSDADNPA